MIQTQFKCSIKIVRSDNGAEFLSHKVTSFMKAQGCIQQTSCAYSPQQNNIVERKHRHLLEVARTLMFQSRVLDFLWGDCVLTATYIINRLPSSVLNGLTPFEVLFKRKLDYQHMGSFGCLCYMTNILPGKSKLESSVISCIFIGYAFNQKGYKVFDLNNHVTYVSRDVRFVEEIFPCVAMPKSVEEGISSSDFTVPLPQCSIEGIPTLATPLPTSTTIAPEIADLVEPVATQDQPPRRTTRTHRPNVTLRDFVCNTVMASKTEYPIHKFLDYTSYSTTHQHYALQVLSDDEPTCYTKASKDPKWNEAMETELKALNSNNTREIADLPPGKNPVGSKWIYRIKRNSDGTISRYKARLVVRGFTQLEGLDYHETFAPVVKMNTIRSFLAVAVSKGWPLFQLYVDNAFLHGHLDEEVYMSLPPGFSDALVSFGFVQSLNDHSLFTYDKEGIFLALLAYVDDVILTGTSSSLIQSVKTYIHDLFRIKDLGQMRYFLGFEVARASEGLFLNQRKYALELIAEAGLLACKPSSIPMDTKHKLSLSTAPALDDPCPYRRLVGQLIYLTNTRPDNAYYVHILSKFMNQPTTDHLTVAHKVLRYLKLAPAQGLFYPSHQPLQLEAHCDADWGACPLTRKSITGYAVTLGHALISWKTKK
ncbi:unnamed protein product [Rhodiola kirilowii]